MNESEITPGRLAAWYIAERGYALEDMEMFFRNAPQWLDEETKSLKKHDIDIDIGHADFIMVVSDVLVEEIRESASGIAEGIEGEWTQVGNGGGTRSLAMLHD